MNEKFQLDQILPLLSFKFSRNEPRGVGDKVASYPDRFLPGRIDKSGKVEVSNEVLQECREEGSGDRAQHSDCCPGECLLY